jgi:hypothetical protein
MSRRQRLAYKKLSQYEGEKRTDLQAQAIAEGHLAPRIVQSDKNVQIWQAGGPICDMCQTRKHSTNLVRIRDPQARGTKRVRGMKGWYIQICDECKRIVPQVSQRDADKIDDDPAAQMLKKDFGITL